MTLGQWSRPALPSLLKDKVPARPDASAHRWPTRRHERKVLMLMGCVQPTMMPNINSATARVLDAAGIQTLVADSAGCCGALRTHLTDVEGGRADMRRNIDAWWPMVQGQGGAGRVEAIVMNASGCGVMVKDYAHALADDPAYAGKARRISELTRDVSELLPELVALLKPNDRPHPTQARGREPHPHPRRDETPVIRLHAGTASNCAAASRRVCSERASRSSCRARKPLRGSAAPTGIAGGPVAQLRPQVAPDRLERGDRPANMGHPASTAATRCGTGLSAGRGVVGLMMRDQRTARALDRLRAPRCTGVRSSS
jgi:hypothetical protein